MLQNIDTSHTIFQYESFYISICMLKSILYTMYLKLYIKKCIFLDFEDILVTVSYILKKNTKGEFWCTYEHRWYVFILNSKHFSIFIFKL